MMLLSQKEFFLLWKDCLGKYVNRSDNGIDFLFEKYQERENQLEDYLDIFRGIDTRQQRNMDVSGPHPYNDLLHLKYKIKYFLIAEAAPSSGKYIYGGSSSRYLTAPLKAFDGLVGEAQNRFKRLAESGVVILDIFPFNLEYNKSNLREKLLANFITENFFKNPNNAYSVLNRIDYICNTIRNTELDPKVNLAMMATPRINDRLCGMHQENNLIQSNSKIKMQKSYLENNGDSITNEFGSIFSLGKMKKPPQFAAACNDGSGLPNATLIRSALDLKNSI